MPRRNAAAGRQHLRIAMNVLLAAYAALIHGREIVGLAGVSGNGQRGQGSVEQIGLMMAGVSLEDALRSPSREETAARGG